MSEKKRKELLIKVIIQDSNRKTFIREWKATASHVDAIRWTMESDDLPHYVDVDNIVRITVVRNH